MNNKTTTTFMAICVATASLCAGAASNDVVRAQTQEELTGGFIIQPISGKIVAFRNKQSLYAASQLEEVVGQLRETQNIPAFVLGADEKRDNVGIEVVLTDAPVIEGTTLLAAPEQSKAFLSVGWLLADKPNDKRRQRRLQIELFRAFAAACGAGTPLYPPCVMARICSASDIDRARSREYGPEALSNIGIALKKSGVQYIRHATYLQACQEGWAAAPTNDIQKAIWGKVHAIPKNPMKIEFDPKKGR